MTLAAVALLQFAVIMSHVDPIWALWFALIQIVFWRFFAGLHRSSST